MVPSRKLMRNVFTVKASVFRSYNFHSLGMMVFGSIVLLLLLVPLPPLCYCFAYICI